MSFRPLALILLLAGCEALPPTTPPPDAACDAASYDHLVGRSRDVLAAMTFPEPMRVYTRGDMITQDYVPERLNVVLDERGTIVRVWCG